MLQGVVAHRLVGAARRAAGPELVSGRLVGRVGTVHHPASGVVGLTLFVRPGGRVVLAGVRVEPGEQSAEVLGVAEVLVHDGRGVGIGDHVVVEPEVVAEHVVDQAAEQGDVGSGSDRDVSVGHRAGAGEARVDMDDPGSARLRLGNPLEPHRVCFGHVAALQHDAIGVGHVLQRLGGAAARTGPRPGTVAECQIRAWFSIWIAPAAVNNFLMR